MFIAVSSYTDYFTKIITMPRENTIENSDSSISELLNHLKRTGLLKRLNPDEIDILDSLWLAVKMGEDEESVNRVDSPSSPKVPTKIPITVEEEVSDEIVITFLICLLIQNRLNHLVSLFLPKIKPQDTIEVITKETPQTEPSSPNNPQGFPFQVPAAPAIQNGLLLSRALRPLMRKVSSLTKTVLDENGTASRIAERDIWLPVTKPQRERWLTLELVIEESNSSFIWRQLVNDLQNLLEVQGAFLNIRTWQIFSYDNQKLNLVRRRKNTEFSQKQYSHKELIHPNGRGLVLLVSDCISPIWKYGLIYPWLKDWSEKQPSAIVQLFSERLWDSTQLSRGRKLAATASTAGLPNPKLQLKNYPQWLPIDWSKTLLVPVITLEPEILQQWAKVVSGMGQTQVSSLMFDLKFINKRAKELRIEEMESLGNKGNEGRETTEGINENVTEGREDKEGKKETTQEVEERASSIVRRYFNTASEPAIQLATMMAAAPVNMSVIDLLRKTYHSEISIEPVHVAEFYMGGLIKPIVNHEDGQYRVYDFLPGVRKVLNEAIGRRRTLKILDAISQYIAEKINSPIRSFEALLTSLSDYTPDQKAKILPFAQVSMDVLRNLGGEYAEFAEEVATNISNLNSPPTPEDEQSSEPPSKTCPFDFATIEIIETHTFDFTVATIEKETKRRLLGLLPGQEKWVIKQRQGKAEGIIEQLGEGISLELMEIPGGTFWMGTDDEEIERLVKKFGGEWFRRESPQHQVNIEPFYMGCYPITQGQWKAIASRKDLQVNPDINLDSEPSEFKDDPLQPPLQEGEREKTRWDRPVEQVNWYEAKEFCDRLSKLTGKEYRLPTEAEWEYACRAVINDPSSVESKDITQAEWNQKYQQPFHFGDTITADLANYDANYTYEDEPKGEYREQTTPVGYFGVANAFGLYDMQGNVLEWCEDDYHENYKGAPNDVTAWLKSQFLNLDNQSYSQENDDNKPNKVIRGGSWNYDPDVCRCAYRLNFNPRDDLNNVGFRVGSGPPRT